MSSIDDRQNVQEIGILNANRASNDFVFTATNFPTNKPPQQGVVILVNYENNENPVNTIRYTYLVWSDLNDDFIAGSNSKWLRFISSKNKNHA